VIQSEAFYRTREPIPIVKLIPARLVGLVGLVRGSSGAGVNFLYAMQTDDSWGQGIASRLAGHRMRDRVDACRWSDFFLKKKKISAARRPNQTYIAGQKKSQILSSWCFFRWSD
jgi:hypothetical protein